MFLKWEEVWFGTCKGTLSPVSPQVASEVEGLCHTFCMMAVERDPVTVRCQWKLAIRWPCRWWWPTSAMLLASFICIEVKCQVLNMGGLPVDSFLVGVDCPERVVLM